MEKKNGWHPLYLWGIAYVLLTYLYVGGFFFGIDQNNTAIVLISAAVPFILSAVSLILALVLRNKIHRDHFLNTAMLIRYCVIPYYLAGFAVGFMGVLGNIIVPFLMIFAGFLVALIIFFFGYITLLGTVPFIFVYTDKGVKEGSFTKNFALVIKIAQFVFVADTISALVAAFKEKKLIKATIAAVIITAILISAVVFLLLLGILTH